MHQFPSQKDSILIYIYGCAGTMVMRASIIEKLSGEAVMPGSPFVNSFRNIFCEIVNFISQYSCRSGYVHVGLRLILLIFLEISSPVYTMIVLSPKLRFSGDPFLFRSICVPEMIVSGVTDCRIQYELIHVFGGRGIKGLISVGIVI
ncbi:MAG: hypothetical protein R6X10_19260 [Desulfobacterales bacterium]